MLISEIIGVLEKLAPPALQESYDNSGLLTGNTGWTCTGVLISLDATEEVVQEAKARGCNLVVSHHPILFSGLKKITGKNYVERAVISSIKEDVALYAIHTNLDNIKEGVNGKIADLLGLVNRTTLAPRENILKKLVTFVPSEYLEKLSSALFEAGAGHIGNYSECSFSSPGTGTYLAGPGSRPFVGELGRRHQESEYRLEVVYPTYMEKEILTSLRNHHPYEEVAYDLLSLGNRWDRTGAGIMGELPEPTTEAAFLASLQAIFRVPVIRHTPFLDKVVNRVAVCGGAGSFLINRALQLKADVYITADMKYHEFFDANGRMLIADIGHFESEQYTVDLLYDILAEKFPTFAVFKTEVQTNPVNYFI